MSQLADHTISIIVEQSEPLAAGHRLAFGAWAMREAPLERQVEIIRSAGYAGICLVSGAGLPLDAVSADGAERRRIRRLLDEAALALTAIAGHADLLEPDPARRAARVARIRATLELAADLAGPTGPPPVSTMGYGTPETYLADREALAERFGELAAHAAIRRHAARARQPPWPGGGGKVSALASLRMSWEEPCPNAYPLR